MKVIAVTSLLVVTEDIVSDCIPQIRCFYISLSFVAVILKVCFPAAPENLPEI